MVPHLVHISTGATEYSYLILDVVSFSSLVVCLLQLFCSHETVLV